MSSKRVSPDNDISPFEPPEQAPFFEEVGRAMSYWASVEAALAELYAIALNHNNRRPAKVSFWTVVAFEAKRQLADEGISAAIGDNTKLLAKWQKLSDQLRNNAGTRNKIAHGTIVTTSWTTKKGRKRRDTYLAIRYHQRRDQFGKIVDPRTNDPRPNSKDRRSLKQLGSYRKAYNQLMKRLWVFEAELLRHIREREDPEPGIVIRAQTARVLR